ncbi:MAG: hypothetical protein IJL75_03850 [Eubacterium sp.]|nr:hypothetical protein [Eubacterium sp.]
MKRKITAWLLMASLSICTFGLTACGETPKNEQTGAQKQTETKQDAASGGAAESTEGEASADSVAGVTKEQYSKMSADELINTLIKDKTAVTKDEYVNLISTLGFVDIEDNEDDAYSMGLAENITNEAIRTLDGSAVPKLSEYLDDLLASSSPQVRGYGISQVSSLFGVSDTSLASAKTLIANETDDYVLWNATKAL